MSAHTPACELLGIDYPIVQAPVAADPRLPAAVSNAGGLGSLGLSWTEDAGDVVRATAALTDRPFAGNFVLSSDQQRRVDQALSAGLRLVSFIFGDPCSYVDVVHDAGGLVMHTVGSAEEARRAAGCGVDIVVAQGWESGGHVWGRVATLPLVPAVVDAVAPIPVIAAGGIGDARGVAAVLALGAQAAWLGTRFLLAEEMPIHEEYRRRLIAATEADAEWYADLYDVGWPDAPHRAIRNSTAEKWEAAGRPELGSRPGEDDLVAHFASGDPILRYSPAPPMVGTTGEIEALSLWAGQSVALAKQPQPAAEIVAELVSMLPEADLRARIQQHWDASERGDAEAEHAIYAEDAILEYPQSGERFKGRSRIQAQRGGHPAERHFTVRRIVGSGDLWMSECVITYDGAPTDSLSVMEIRDGLVTHETQYFADPFPAPSSRAGLAESAG